MTRTGKPKVPRRATPSASRDRQLIGRDAPASALELVATDGCHVVDARGRRFLDFVMGWCAGNLGWGRPAIVDALRRYDGPDYVDPTVLYRPWVEAAQLLIDLAPGKLARAYRATGGTEAVDFAIQAALAHTGRHAVMSIADSYHGNSLATKSAASSDPGREHGRQLPLCVSIAPPLDEAAAARVERRLRRRDIAAVIMEPVICNLGVLVPQRAFMTRLQRACRSTRTLLIMDEVATGFGRTGRMFACEHFGVEPDIMCVAKAITGGYAPMGATLMTAAVARSMEQVETYSTYGWHPLSVAAALANLGYLRQHRQRLLAHVEALGARAQARLARLTTHADAVRAKGLAIGVDHVDERHAQATRERCRENGLLVQSEDATVLLFPALTIDRALLDEGLDRLARSW